jgi:hypothetical protein
MTADYADGTDEEERSIGSLAKNICVYLRDLRLFFENSKGIIRR